MCRNLLVAWWYVMCMSVQTALVDEISNFRKLTLYMVVKQAKSEKRERRGFWRRSSQTYSWRSAVGCLVFEPLKKDYLILASLDWPKGHTTSYTPLIYLFYESHSMFSYVSMIIKGWSCDFGLYDFHKPSNWYKRVISNNLMLSHVNVTS